MIINGKYIDLRCEFGFKYSMLSPIVMKSLFNVNLEDDGEAISSVKFLWSK